MQDPRLTKRAKRYLRYLAVRVGLWMVSALPLRWASGVGSALGGWAFRIARGEREKALGSLARAFPQLSVEARERLARDCFAHLGRCVFELACVREIDAQMERLIEWPDADRKTLESALARGKGVVFVTGHIGNWELLARRVTMAGFPGQTIAREATDARLTALIERFRADGKVRSIWRGQPGAAKLMLRALKSGEILGLVIDQDTRVQSVFVPFFGHPASTPRAAADLALRTGAAVVMAFCQRQANGRYRLWMKELDVQPTDQTEADVLDLTARMTQEIEDAIRRAPEQWVWMHRRWKTQPC